MRLTKYAHACVRLEKDGEVLVLDPGNFTDVAVALDGADHLLITHEHPDHYDREPVNAWLEAHPEVDVHAPAVVAEELRNSVSGPERIHDADGGEQFSAGAFSVRTYGGQHALIHPQIPVVANVGYLIEESVFHPGDSLVVPDGIEVANLLVPVQAPWNKIQEVIDFQIAVRPERAFPVHDGLLAEEGRQMIGGHLTRFGQKYGTEFQYLQPGESVEL